MTQFIALGILLLAVVLRFGSWLRDRRDLVFYACVCALVAAASNTGAVIVLAGKVLPGVLFDMVHFSLVAHLFMQTGLFFLRSALVSAAAPERLRFSTNTLPFLIATTIQFATYAAVDIEGLKAGVEDSRADPAFLAYMLSFLLYMMSVLAYLTWICIRYVPHMKGALRAGFTVIGIGTVLALTASLMSAAGLVISGTHPGSSLGALLTMLYAALQGVAIIIIGTGIGIPAAMAALGRRRAARTLKRVSALWERTVLAHDLQRLPVGASASPEQRLHRMLIEIRDAHLATGRTMLTSGELAYLEEVESVLARP